MRNKGAIGIISVYMKLLGDSNVAVGKRYAMALGIYQMNCWLISGGMCF